MPNQLHASLDRDARGMKSVVLENEVIRMTILPDRGADIVELVYKPMNVDVLWHSPAGQRRSPWSRAPFVAQDPLEDIYDGGWQDLLPTIGSGPTELHGARFGQHGETALLPWEATVEQDGESARASLSVTGLRYPYVLEKTIELREGRSEILMNEKLTNKGNQTLEFYWLQHPAFGEPLLAPDAKLELPNGSVVLNLGSMNPRARVDDGESRWPLVRAKNGRTIDLSTIPPKDVVAEETTFVRVVQGWYNLTNTPLGLRFGLKWDASIFRWVWFWQNYGVPDYPYFGRAWNIGVEPATSLPTFLGEKAAKDALVLDGDQSVSTKIEAVLTAI